MQRLGRPGPPDERLEDVVPGVGSDERPNEQQLDAPSLPPKHEVYDEGDNEWDEHRVGPKPGDSLHRGCRPRHPVGHEGPRDARIRERHFLVRDDVLHEPDEDPRAGGAGHDGETQHEAATWVGVDPAREPGGWPRKPGAGPGRRSEAGEAIRKTLAAWARVPKHAARQETDEHKAEKR